MICELCFKPSPHTPILPRDWDIVYQSPICPDCIKKCQEKNLALPHARSDMFADRPDPRMTAPWIKAHYQYDEELAQHWGSPDQLRTELRGLLRYCNRGTNFTVDGAANVLHNAINELEYLRELLALIDRNATEEKRVIQAIPPCPIHGQDCIPHALDWIKEKING